MGGNFQFVPVTDSNSPFLGHELCRSNSDTVPEYFNNENENQPDAYTLHPNRLGQQAYATLIENWLTAHPLS
jgi:hypothetical protein